MVAGILPTTLHSSRLSVSCCSSSSTSSSSSCCRRLATMMSIRGGGTEQHGVRRRKPRGIGVRRRRSSGSPLTRAAVAGQEREPPRATAGRERGRWPGQNQGLISKFWIAINSRDPIQRPMCKYLDRDQ
ncbi:hypothetical protein SETIT_7G165100v2 [Setaria italica]|uniref:Uncharacterized protein n=1 Tax=Setaria italica TaxID=4555 RepID=A0A368RWE0_SETIT|nr:hypothetical protein SETIT_7G165100v2 [Setaria italica]